MIKLVMLTGFLGAGKTTLLQRITDEYADCRIGVLVNEFGAVSVDSEILRNGGVSVTELSDGSIFCACIKDKFVEALIEMSARDIEYLFIEASGLADPASMGDILKGIEGRLTVGYEYLHSICIVDCTSFMELKDTLTALDNQIAYSDIIILNKCDSADSDAVNEIEETVYGINPDAGIIQTSYCDIKVRDVVERPSGLNGRSGESGNTYASRLQTVILRQRDTVPYDELMSFIERSVGSTYRIKGFLTTERGGMKIDCAGASVSVEPWEGEIKEKSLVIISSVGIRIMSVVTSALKECVSGSLGV